MTKGEETFESIYDLISPRLDNTGKIKFEDVWRIAKREFQYGTVHRVFIECMRTMMEQGKAQVVKRGSYIILKPNNPLR